MKGIRFSCSCSSAVRPSRSVRDVGPSRYPRGCFIGNSAQSVTGRRKRAVRTVFAAVFAVSQIDVSALVLRAPSYRPSANNELSSGFSPDSARRKPARETTTKIDNENELLHAALPCEITKSITGVTLGSSKNRFLNCVLIETQTRPLKKYSNTRFECSRKKVIGKT